jgi:hypothetical protein
MQAGASSDAPFSDGRLCLCATPKLVTQVSDGLRAPPIAVGVPPSPIPEDPAEPSCTGPMGAPFAARQVPFATRQVPAEGRVAPRLGGQPPEDGRMSSELASKAKSFVDGERARADRP